MGFCWEELDPQTFSIREDEDEGAKRSNAVEHHRAVAAPAGAAGPDTRLRRSPRVDHAPAAGDVEVVSATSGSRRTAGARGYDVGSCSGGFLGSRYLASLAWM